MKLFYKLFVAYFLFVTTVNAVFCCLVAVRFCPTEELYRGGLVVKIKPLRTVYVFAHGWYDYGYAPDPGLENWRQGWLYCWHDAVVYHEMRLGDIYYSTLDLS